MTKSKAAYLLATQTLGKQSLFMWTFTFREVLDIKDTRKRWNHLLTLLKQTFADLCGLRVFELHQFHGLHVHLVTNRLLDVDKARLLAKQAGWGRIHVMRIPIERAGYLAKYLSKERPACLKRWRLWAGFGEWDWTRVKDLLSQSRFSTIYRACQKWLRWTGNKGFFERVEFVALLEMRSAIEGWSDGFGPGGKPYGMCTREEIYGACARAA